MNDAISWVMDKINWLYSAPAAVLFLLSCIVVGYVLRGIKRFPNDAIPLVVVLWAAVASVLLAPEEPTGTPHRVWLCKNALIGVIIGFAAWACHKKILKRLEDKVPWLSGLFSTGNTDQIKNPNPPTPAEPPKSNP